MAPSCEEVYKASLDLSSDPFSRGAIKPSILVEIVGDAETSRVAAGETVLIPTLPSCEYANVLVKKSTDNKILFFFILIYNLINVFYLAKTINNIIFRLKYFK
jgi:hypothetical protein